VQPAPAGLVLISLIAVAAVANLNLPVANFALPSIGRAFDSSRTTLDLIAVGYSLGLAASVLYPGALSGRYGRKLMPILGMALSVPACLLAAFAPSDGCCSLLGYSEGFRGHGLSDNTGSDCSAVVRARTLLQGAICVGSGVARLHRLPLLPALDRVHDDPGPEADDHDASDHLSGNQHPSRLGHGRNITEPDG
jgi:MFS family permease